VIVNILTERRRAANDSKEKQPATADGRKAAKDRGTELLVDPHDGRPPAHPHVTPLARSPERFTTAVPSPHLSNVEI